MFSSNSFADRIKDFADIAGQRSNQLVGYGLVVGLDGTGDQTTQTPFTLQSVLQMIGVLGVTIPQGGGQTQIRLEQAPTFLVNGKGYGIGER